MDLVDELTSFTGGTSNEKEIRNEIRNGAFVVLMDMGSFYHTHDGSTRCWTEHVSIVPVYDIVGKTGTVLVGITETGDSWVQWERSQCLSTHHCCDWIRYKWSGKNQGPFGETGYTEQNPITLKTNVENPV